MRSLSKVVGGAIAAVLVGALPCNAVTITGEIHFGGEFVPIDAGGNPIGLGSATGLNFINPAAVITASGDFSSVPLWTPNTTFIPSMQFNPLSPSPVDPLWTVGGFSFTMQAVQIVLQTDNQLNLLGSGYISGNGFEPTYGTWNFTGGGAGLFTFRANDTANGVPVPDGGDTLLLLGLALLSVTVFASRRVLA